MENPIPSITGIPDNYLDEHSAGQSEGYNRAVSYEAVGPDITVEDNSDLLPPSDGITRFASDNDAPRPIDYTEDNSDLLPPGDNSDLPQLPVDVIPSREALVPVYDEKGDFTLVPPTSQEPESTEAKSDEQVSFYNSIKNKTESWFHGVDAVGAEILDLTSPLWEFPAEVAFASVEADFYKEDPMPWYMDMVEGGKRALTGTTRDGVAMDRFTYIGEKASVVSDLYLAAIAAEQDPNSLPLEQIETSMKAVGQSITDRYNYEYGDDPISHGDTIMEKYYPDTSPGKKVAGAIALDVIGPAAPFMLAKLVQKGLRRVFKKDTPGVPGEETGSVISEGIDDIAESAGIPDEEVAFLKALGKDAEEAQEKITRAKKFAITSGGTGDPAYIKFVEEQTKIKDDALAQITKTLDSNENVKKAVVYDEINANRVALEGLMEKGDDLLGTPKQDRFSFSFRNRVDQSQSQSAVLNMLETNDSILDIKVNYSRVNNKGDIHQLAQEIGQMVKSETSKFIPGTPEYAAMYSDQVKKLSDLTGLKIDPVMKLPLEDIVAYRTLLLSLGDSMHHTAKVIRTGAGGGVETVLYDKMLTTTMAITEMLTGKGNRASRLLQTQQMKGETAAVRVKELQHQMQIAGSDRHVNRSIDRVLKDDPGEYNSLMRFISKVTDPLARTRAIESSLFRKITGSVFEKYTNALLAGIGTQTTNIKSTGAFMLGEPMHKVITGMSYLSSGKAREAWTQFGSAGTELQGNVSGMKDAMLLLFKQKSWDSEGIPLDLLNTTDISMQRMKFAISADEWGLQGPLGLVADIFGKAVRIPGATIQGTDRAFKLSIYRGSISSQAFEKARAATQDPAARRAFAKHFNDNPTDDMVDEASRIAKQKTFTEDLGGVARAGQTVINAVPFMKLQVPFYKAMTNMTKTGIKSSAFGDAALIAKATGDPALKSTHLARAKIAMGTVIPGVIVGMLDDKIVGHINPTSPNGRWLRQQKVPPYSIITGENEDGSLRYFEYGKYEPLRFALGVLVNYRDAITGIETTDPKTGKENPISRELLYAATAPFIHTVTDNYMLQALSTVVRLLSVENAGGADVVEKEMARIASTLAVGSFAKQINQTYFDDTFRLSNDFIEKTLSNVPGHSGHLPADVLFWGPDRIRNRSVGIEFLSDFYDQATPQDEIDHEIEALGIGLPTKLPSTITGPNGIPLHLTAKQKHRYGKIRAYGPKGRNDLKSWFKGTMSSKDWRVKMSDNDKRARISNMVTNINKATSEALFAENEALQEQHRKAVEALALQNQSTVGRPLGER